MSYIAINPLRRQLVASIGVTPDHESTVVVGRVLRLPEWSGRRKFVPKEDSHVLLKRLPLSWEGTGVQERKSSQLRVIVQERSLSMKMCSDDYVCLVLKLFFISIQI